MRKEAKERGLKGYSTLSKDQLIQLLNGEMIEKKIKKNQKSKETQTEFKQCEECSLDQELYRLTLKTEKEEEELLKKMELELMLIPVRF